MNPDRAYCRRCGVLFPTEFLDDGLCPACEGESYRRNVL